MATYCCYQKMHRTMHTAFSLYLLKRKFGINLSNFPLFILSSNTFVTWDLFSTKWLNLHAREPVMLNYILKRGTNRNKLEPPEMSWNGLRPPATSWNHLKRYELSNELI